MLLRDRWILFCATGCNIGKIPVAPGTFGSLIGLLLAWSLSGWPIGWQVLFTISFCGISVWVAHRAERLIGAKDPGMIVIDEIAGILIACLGVAPTAAGAITIFILFRLFDVFKPFPVGWLDRHLTGGIGIVADDVAAGILAGIVYRAGYWLIAVM